jgi:lipooligosaccharide transport system permease protein
MKINKHSPLPRLEISSRFLVVLQRNLLVYTKYWRSSMMFNFIEPMLYLAALGVGLGMYIPEIEGMSYLEFIAPGLIASSTMWATSFECTYGSFIRLQVQKSYHAIITTPVSLDEVVLGDIAFGAFKSILYGSVMLLVLLLLGLVASPLALLVPLVLLLSGLVFAQLSMIWTSLAPNFEVFAYYFTLVLTPMFLFSGIFFPLENLPLAAQRLAWLTPLFHTVQLCRGLVSGQLPPAYMAHVLALIIFLLILFLPPLLLMRRRLVQ